MHCSGARMQFPICNSFVGEFTVQGFPSIKLISFSNGKRKVSNYKGDRSAASIIEWALTQAKKISLSRIGAKAGMTLLEASLG